MSMFQLDQPQIASDVRNRQWRHQGQKSCFVAANKFERTIKKIPETTQTASRWVESFVQSVALATSLKLNSFFDRYPDRAFLSLFSDGRPLISVVELKNKCKAIFPKVWVHYDIVFP